VSDDTRPKEPRGSHTESGAIGLSVQGGASRATSTHTYPHQEINDYLRLHPEPRAEVEDTLGHFDGINFADKIACPMVVNIGLQDNVCPMETGYALFNPGNRFCFQRNARSHTSPEYAKLDAIELPRLDPFGGRNVDRK
jgi:hypothetical protein